MISRGNNELVNVVLVIEQMVRNNHTLFILHAMRVKNIRAKDKRSVDGTNGSDQ